jgi:hypothetical protein
VHGTHVVVIVARVVRIEDGTPRNPSDGYGDPDAAMSDLALSAQADIDSDAPLYGFHTRYAEPFSVDTARATMMLRTLRKVDREVARAGYPETFASYIELVARTLKIRGFGAVREQPAGPAGCYDDNVYTWIGAGDLPTHLAGVLRCRRAELRRHT